LAYDTPPGEPTGDLILKAHSSGSTPKSRGRGIYLDESKAVKRPGHLTDRPAMYKLADRYGLDPVDLFQGKYPEPRPSGYKGKVEVEVGTSRNPVETSEIRVRREDIENPQAQGAERKAIDLVSREHASIGRD